MSVSSGTSQELQAVSADDVCVITQDVWESFLAVRITQVPVADLVAGRPSTVGAVRVADAWFGAVVLELSPGLARQVAATMFESTPEAVTEAEIVDALGELTNMIGGNVKSLLPAPSQLSLPMVTDSVWPTTVPGSVCVCQVGFSVGPDSACVSVWQS